MQHDLPDSVGVSENPTDGVGRTSLALRQIPWEPLPFKFVDLTPLFAEWLGYTEAEFRTLGDLYEED